MLIDFQEILKVLPNKPKSILHAGAHLCEEKEIYDKAGIPYVFWVECNPELFKEVVKKVTIQNCTNYAVAAKEGLELDFHRVYSLDRTNRGCSSLLKPTSIMNSPYLEQIDTIKVKTTTIDKLNLDNGPFDFLVMDIQGAEKEALKGAILTLQNPNLRGILLEFTKKSMYEGDCLLDELDNFLLQYSFKRVITKYATDDTETGWGDSLFIRK